MNRSILSMKLLKVVLDILQNLDSIEERGSEKNFLIIYSGALEFFDQNACALTGSVASGACNQGPKARGDTQWR